MWWQPLRLSVLRDASMPLAANTSKTIWSLFRGCYRPSSLASHGAFCVNTRQLWGRHHPSHSGKMHTTALLTAGPGEHNAGVYFQSASNLMLYLPQLKKGDSPINSDDFYCYRSRTLPNLTTAHYVIATFMHHSRAVVNFLQGHGPGDPPPCASGAARVRTSWAKQCTPKDNRIVITLPARLFPILESFYTDS